MNHFLAFIEVGCLEISLGDGQVDVSLFPWKLYSFGQSPACTTHFLNPFTINQ